MCKSRFILLFIPQWIHVIFILEISRSKIEMLYVEILLYKFHKFSNPFMTLHIQIWNFFFSF